MTLERILFVGNCMTGSFCEALQLLLPSSEVVGIHVSDASDASMWTQVREAIAAGPAELLCVDSHLNRFRQEVPEHGTVQLVPALSFSGLHPDAIYVSQSSSWVRSGIDSEWNSALVLGAYLGARTPRECRDLFSIRNFETLGYLDEFDRSTRALLHRFGSAGLDGRWWLDSVGSIGTFMYGPTHPVAAGIGVLAFQTARQLGAPVDVQHDFHRADFWQTYLYDYLRVTVWPVYPELADRLGLTGSYVFKHDKTHVSLDQFIERCYASWDEQGLLDSEITSVPVRALGSVRHLLSGSSGASPANHPPKADEPRAFGALVHEATWKSEDTYCDLRELLKEFLERPNPVGLQDTLQLAELTVRLRHRPSYDLASQRLETFRTNPWAFCLYAEIELLRSGAEAASTLLTSALPDDVATFPEPVKHRLLQLSSKVSIPDLESVYHALGDRNAGDFVLFDARYGIRHAAAAGGRYLEMLRSRHHGPDERLHRMLSILSQIESAQGGPVANVHLHWSDVNRTHSSWLANVLAKTREAAAAKRGLSILRLGDGEAVFLLGDRPDLAGAAGHHPDGSRRSLDTDEYRQLRELLEVAVQQADLVVVPDLGQVLHGPERWIDIFDWIGDTGIETERFVAGTHWFPYEFETNGLLEELVEVTHGIIGPSNPALAQPFMGREVEWLRVPGEAGFLDKSKSQDSHFHDYFPSIISHPFRSGDVWLVAAGILGKFYCEAIRARGAVAIDIGSVMDLWVGRGDTRQVARLYPWIAAPYSSCR